MKLLSELRQNLTKIDKEKLLVDYFLKETDIKAREFVNSISNMSETTMSLLIKIFIDEQLEFTVGDFVTNQDDALFEMSERLFQYAGDIDGTPYFKMRGHPELVNLPLDQKVKRIF